MKLPVVIYKRPRLREPYMVVGWADAGYVGINAIDYLTYKLGAQEMGEIEPHEFSMLPHALVKSGVLQRIDYSGSTFYYWKNRKSGHDLILFASKVPALQHYRFAELLFEVAEHFHVSRIYTVGGLSANMSHNEASNIFAIINNPKLKRYVTRHGVAIGGDFYGPATMNSLLLGVAREKGIDGISLWGEVPAYISEVPNPQVSKAVLEVVTKMLAIDVDFSDIDAEAHYARKQIDEMVSYLRQQDPELDRHIGMLDRASPRDLLDTGESDQDFFRELGEFLKKHRGRHKDDRHDN